MSGNQLQKRDAGKPQMSRFPWRAGIPVVRVLEFGKFKYGEWGGWKKVDNAIERYTDALFRHVADLAEYGLDHLDICESHNGDRPFDCRDCSGLPTLAHAVCDGLFLLWFAVKKDPGQPWLKRVDPLPAQGPTDEAILTAWKGGGCCVCLKPDRGPVSYAHPDCWIGIPMAARLKVIDLLESARKG